MYLGPGYTVPSQFRLKLEIPYGETVELVLFEALLCYANGMHVIITVNGEYLMHGRETCELIAANPKNPGIKGKVFYLEGNVDQISRAFNAEDCDWPELLEAARENFMNDSQPSESYVDWLKYEITKRGGEAMAA